MAEAARLFRSFEPLARTIASVFRLEWIPAIAKLPTDGLYHWEHVPYRAGTSDPKHTLDVFIPGRSPSAPFPRERVPVVMFWHGGAWRRGDKRWHGALYSNVGVACARAGFVGVVCNYRLQPQVSSWRDQVDDVAAAVAWATRAAEQYGGDSNQLFLAGHSAGAHLVASLLSDASALERHGVSAEEAQERIQGAMLLAGVYDVPRLARLPVGGALVARSSFGARKDGREWASASPSKLIRAVGDRASLLRDSGQFEAPDAAAIRRGDTLSMPSGHSISGSSEARMCVSPREAAALDAISGTKHRSGSIMSHPSLELPLVDEGRAFHSDSALTAGSRVCPLLSVPTLLLNASDDFHLDGDAVSLIRATAVARHQLQGDLPQAHAQSLDPDTDSDAENTADAEGTAWWESAKPHVDGDDDDTQESSDANRKTSVVSGGDTVSPRAAVEHALSSAQSAVSGVSEALNQQSSPQWLVGATRNLLGWSDVPREPNSASKPHQHAKSSPNTTSSNASRSWTWEDQWKSKLGIPQALEDQWKSKLGIPQALEDQWKSKLGIPQALDTLTTTLVTAVTKEAELLEDRLQHAWDQGVVASFRDEVALPEPLVEWEQLRAIADASVGGRLSGGPQRDRRDMAGGGGAATVTNGPVMGGSPGYASTYSFKGLEIRGQPGTNMAWGRVGHRNHITLVALIGQEGDPATSALVEFVRSGHKTLAESSVKPWDAHGEEERT